MTNYWIEIKGKYKYGIAIHKFNGENNKSKLSLQFLQKVNLIYQSFNSEWFYGSIIVNDKEEFGIFPCCFIKTFDSSSFPEMTLVEEITYLLREWLILWKGLYLNDKENFKVLQNKMNILINLRSQIISQTLPLDELKRVKHDVTSTMDVGNKMLGLDLVVRDEQCNLINPEITSTTDMFKLHQNVTQQIIKRNNITSYNNNNNEQNNYSTCHSIGVTINDWIFKSNNYNLEINNNLQYFYFLYDSKQNKIFTEYFVIHKSPMSLLERMTSTTTITSTTSMSCYNNMKVLFTDLNSCENELKSSYLVCYVVRIGNLHMEKEDKEKFYSKETKSISDVRRAYGVAALDIKLFTSGKFDVDEEHNHFMPFITCDKDNLENTLKRLLSSLNDLSSQELNGVYVNLSFFFNNSDNKNIKNDSIVHSVAKKKTIIARKMGFPDIILPSDVRNDLYITIVNGEFKFNDKNIQITVQVYNQNGNILKGVVILGAGIEPQSQYDSIVYYREEKPRWCETFKLAIPIEEFKASHLRITYKHRSSNESKDEKALAFSFIKLMQENGTTLPDITHDLLVYKIDKKIDIYGSDTSYLSLPSTRAKLNELGKLNHVSGFTLNTKDVLVISTNVCSTKLTNNVDLLGLLNWTSDLSRVKHSLVAFMKVDGEEIVKFLQDVLDVLFDILVQNHNNSENYDTLVFKCLLYIFGLVLDRKYEHFQQVLDIYIEESFSATLAYDKLIQVLKYDLQNGSTDINIMKCLHYIIRIIVKSRLLFSTLYEGRGDEEFQQSLHNLFMTMATAMSGNDKSKLVIQGACLKYLPSTIPYLLHVFQPNTLSNVLIHVINSVPSSPLTKQRLMSLSSIVHSELFVIIPARAMLLPPILHTVKQFLEAKDEVQLCVEILSDIMNILWNNSSSAKNEDIEEIMLTMLRTIIQSVISMNRESTLVGHLVAIMLSIFRHMSTHHYDVYVSHFPMRSDLLDFVTEILLTFKDLISHPVYSNDWIEMILLQNSIILKSLRYFSHIVRDNFSQPFEKQAWSNWFHCACVFITQPALQLENFTLEKRNRILNRYKDMRKDTAFEIRTMWFNLGQNKILFIPSLVGLFLEMTLIPEQDLRRETIPLFFDMMQCEFYSCKDRDGTFIKANFTEFEIEMISKLDSLIEGGLGDLSYKELFQSILSPMCESHSTLKDCGGRFIRNVTRQMDALLEYRSLVKNTNPEIRMSCTVRLLEFYSETSKKELYLRYVNKLFAQHLAMEDYTEAAHTLALHAQLLTWNNTPLPLLLKSIRHPRCTTHRELKEKLYLEAIVNFDKGKMWECALGLCKELYHHYEESTFDYIQVSELLRRMAGFYESILRQLRIDCGFFRVGYYGRGFPTILQNKVFVYRAKEYEQLSDFTARILNQVPNAELMNKLSPPDVDITESKYQYVQINAVHPVMSSDDQKKFSDKPISEQILRYYKNNHVQKFEFSRRDNRKSMEYNNDKSADVPQNEFANLWLERTMLVTSYPLPGILRWFPVTSTNTYHISPLKCAIETMEKRNKDLKQIILTHKNDSSLPLHPLTMNLNGTVDAAVNGGIVNYENAFFSSEYISTHPNETHLITKLQDLIASQIPLLEIGLRLHAQRVPPDIEPLHRKMEDLFNELRQAVESKYGKKKCDIKLDIESSIRLRRHASMGGQADSNRPGNSQTNHKSASSMSSGIPFFNGPVCVRKLGTYKKDKKRRTDSKPLLDVSTSSSISSSKFYDTASLSSELDCCSNTVIELREELIASRPLRSEVEREKRLSRTTSKDSLSTEEDNLIPPLLPAKQKEVEYCNILEDTRRCSGGSITSTPLRHFGTSGKAALPKPTDDDYEQVETDEAEKPPTPPPKKPYMKINF